ncbi:MAG: hypothetical protein IH616_04175 [Gemmatimonadales bacterium]|nr:hypothetical protein [Gemmatimonadales bacterium]
MARKHTPESDAELIRRYREAEKRTTTRGDWTRAFRTISRLAREVM